MALDETRITQNIDASFNAAAGYSATELSAMVVAMVFITLFIWSAWGAIGSLLNLTNGSSSVGGFGVALGLIIAVLIIGTFLISQ